MSTSHIESPADSARPGADLEELAYIAGHDLQGPLRKLVAYCQLLSQDLQGQLPDKAQSDLNHIVEAAQGMRQTLQDWIALARIGSTPLHRTDVDLDRCADAALAALKGRIAESRATVDRDSLPRLCGDADLLSQLYQHLIDNALKFCGDDPPRIQLTARFEDGAWILGVRDEGVGIGADHVQSVFAPTHGPRSSSERRDVNGIVLAMCRRIVARHGGRMWVESRPQRGAHFKFSLPG